MKNLLTYVQEYGHQSFEQKEVGDVDILVMTELAYLTYDDIVPYTFEERSGISFERIWKSIEPIQQELLTTNPMMITTERLELLKAVANSTRFQLVRVFGYVNDIDEEVTKQFAATLYQWNQNKRLVVFRGTDETLIGWKEDFMMTYLEKIPAQTAAKKYFRKQAATFEGTFIVSGHSKGGNLSLYASMMQETDLQDRIEKVYCFDSPGVHHHLVEQAGYQRIIPKTARFLPQDSIVGMMLESQIPCTIIHSFARGAEQHSAMTWTVEEDHFVEMPELTRNSMLMDQTFKKWTETVDDEDLAAFFDYFFDVLLDIGIDTVNDVFGKLMFYIQKFFTRAHQMPVEKREVLTRVAFSLFQLRYEVWCDSLDLKVEVPSFSMSKLEEIVSKFQLSSPTISIEYLKNEENESIRSYYRKRYQQKIIETVNKKPKRRTAK